MNSEFLIPGYGRQNNHFVIANKMVANPCRMRGMHFADAGKMVG
nr:MAG TPA: hypothetical protein [Caudoviricetes sp.]